MKHEKLVSEVAKLYYSYDCTQVEIANRYNLSRATVSRLLAEARSTGIVKIFIEDDFNGNSSLEEELTLRYKLKTVRVVSTPAHDHKLAQQLVAQSAANLFSSLLQPDDILGVGWGSTIYAVAQYFPDLPMNNMKLIQLVGNIDNVCTRSHSGEIMSILSQKLGTNQAFSLPCPAMLDNPLILDMMLHDSKIHQLLEATGTCTKLLVNLATADEQCCLYKAGYISDADLELLHQKDATGSICCRFVDSEGHICDEVINNRTFGISIPNIDNSPLVMACVASPKKAPVLRACLRAGYIDVLVVDSVTAEHLLKKRSGEAAHF